jgi:GNAT superfamily N-acetyltransferase
VPQQPRIHTFGELRLEVPGAIPLTKPIKGLALLAYLTVVGKPIFRTEAAALLWDPSRTDNGLRSLSQVLYELKRILPPGCLAIRPHSLGLAAADSASSDAADFLRLVDRGAYADALKLYRAPFLREVLPADIVTVVPVSEANPGRTEGGHRAVITIAATAVVLKRGWAPFTDIELARGRALLSLLGAAHANVAAPAVATCDDGSAVVLRGGTPADSDALSAMHARCSMETLAHRYHTGSRTVPRRWLHRLLVPPRGISVLAVCGRDVVGLGQLIPSGIPDTAEVSLLVEDAWQRNGLGTALIARLNLIASARGYGTLVATGVRGRQAVLRASQRAGLTAHGADIDGQYQISVTTEAAVGMLP